MNPIKNKKDLETTIEQIRNFAYSYLEKYSPSNIIYGHSVSHFQIL